MPSAFSNSNQEVPERCFLGFVAINQLGTVEKMSNKYKLKILLIEENPNQSQDIWGDIKGDVFDDAVCTYSRAKFKTSSYWFHINYTSFIMIVADREDGKC